jgi:benzylsuccinate CoA-transferase BbsF subunit
LQNAGIPAGVAQHVEDLVRRDPQLAARDFFEEIAHCDGGRVLASRPGFRLQETGGRTTDTGRAIGADNERVLAQWLGFSADDLDHHRRAGILEQ